MRDKRPVDELSVEELERVLAIKRREERQKQLERMRRSGRVIEATAEPVDVQPEPSVHIPATAADIAVEAPDPVAAALTAMTRVDTPPAQPKPTPPAPSRITFEQGEAVPHFDEAGDDSPPVRRARSRSTRKLMDRVLLLVEVVAVIMIGVVGINLVAAIGTLERETASAQALADEQRRAGIPTIAPTPTLRLEQVVLPGGHIFSTAGAPQFNFSEVPDQFHARVQSEWIQPVISRPPQTSETALSLTVPKLNLDGTIVQGVDWEALKQGVGQLPNGVNPGDDVGNVVLAAHDDVYGQLFRYLDTLQPGDTFQIRTQTNVFTYSVTQQFIVDPNDVYVLENRQGATATLISCYPYQVNTHRIVIFADRVS